MSESERETKISRRILFYNETTPGNIYQCSAECRSRHGSCSVLGEILEIVGDSEHHGGNIGKSEIN